MTEINETIENITPQPPAHSNGMSNKVFLTLLGVLGLILACALFYFFYWIKTPAYTVGIIKTAIEKKDMASFEKYVDLDKMLSTAFVTSARADLANPDSEESKKILAKAEMQKKPFSDDMSKKLLNEIQTFGNTDKPKSPFNFIEYKGTGNSTTDGNTATVDIKIFNTKLNKEFILTLGMEKLPNGIWKVTSIKNLVEYEALLNQATHEKLLEVNKTKIEEIAKEIQIGKVTTELTESKDTQFSHLLKINIPLTFLTDRNVSTLHGLITIYKGDKLIASYPLPPLSGSSQKGKEAPLTLPLPLSSFFARDALIIATPNDQLIVNLTITKVQFADKSVIELADDVPTIQNK